MERLTVPDERIDQHMTRRQFVDAAAVREHAMEFYWRLKAYEDTGLSPIACARAAEIERRLHENGYSIARMVELMKADVLGQLEVLQCRPGQHVFVMRGYDQRICECVVTRIILAKGYRAAEVESADGTEMGYGFPLLEWGRTAFATREEAERAEKPDVCFAKAQAAEAADEVLKGARDGH